MRILQLSVLLAAVALPLSAMADTYTFSYVGNDFTSVSNDSYDLYSIGTPYTTSDFVTAEFTVSLPAPLTNTNLESLTPTSFSLSDGAQTITNTTPDLIYTEFEISTNAEGAITGWLIDANGNADSPGIETSTTSYQGDADGANNGYDGATSSSNYAYNYDPGTWTIIDDTTLAATPEPSSLILLATGLLGVGGVLRRRLA